MSPQILTRLAARSDGLQTRRFPLTVRPLLMVLVLGAALRLWQLGAMPVLYFDAETLRRQTARRGCTYS
jgi:hypothetical protein